MLVLERIHNGEQVRQRPAQTIQLPDDEYVTGRDEFKRPRQPRSIALRIDTGGEQSVALQIRALPVGVRRYAHVADQHRRITIKRRFPYGSASRHGFPYICVRAQAKEMAQVAGKDQASSCFDRPQPKWRLVTRLLVLPRVGVNRSGAFAEHIVLPMTNIWLQAPWVDLEVAAIFDPLGNAVHTALAFPLVGEDVLVTGAGPIGIMAAAVARRAGARRVVISDPNPFRRALAEKVGATLAVDPAATRLREVQQQIGMQEGFDVGLEMSGNAAAFREMLENMSQGAKIAMLGIPAKEMAIDWNRVIFNQLTLRGVYGREMYETWYKMTVLLESGLDVSGVITHRFGFRDFAAGFEAMASGESGKVILDWCQ